MGITREQLYSELGMLEIVAPLILAGYERQELRDRRDGSGDSPHGSRWSTSFHSSSFPGRDESACGRRALYTLMDIPESESKPPRLLAMFEGGTDMEHNWVRKLRAEGVLLSNDVTLGDAHQTGFADKEHWLTGASDAIILPPFWSKSLCVEIKQTSLEKVQAMQQDPESVPMSHPKYLRQLGAYIALAREQPYTPTVTVCKETWAITTSPIAGLHWCPLHQTLECPTMEITVDSPDAGVLIYGAREEPLTTVSYMVQHDEDQWQQGLARIAEWRDDFINGVLPEHPHNGNRAMWSVEPCKWCLYKKEGCKEDYKDGVKTLANSNQIKWAKKVKRVYDYDAQRKSVLGRWGVEDKS